MAIETILTVEDKYILIKLKGEFSLTEVKNKYKYVIDTAVEYNKSRLLVDIYEVTGTMSFIERFEISAFLALYYIQHAAGKIYRVAFMGNEPLVDKGRFGETVAKNRGLNVRVFTNKEDAIAWIEE
jgi:hypothetical protein